MKMGIVILVICIPLSRTMSMGSLNGPTDTTASADLKVEQRKWYKPQFIPLQFAGNIGFISFGAGYGSRSGDYQFSLLYSYTPASVAGERIHTITAKNVFQVHAFSIDEHRSVLPYVGLAVSLEAGGRSFFFQPSHMPKSYYDFPKSIHLIASGGIKMRHMTDKSGLFQGMEFAAELTTVDAYIWYNIISDEVKMHDIMSLSIGINFLLK